MRLQRGLQKEIAEKAKVSNGWLSTAIQAKKRPSWPVAKRLAEATNTSPVLWLEGTEAQIKGVLAGKLADPFGACSLERCGGPAGKFHRHEKSACHAA